MVKNGKAHSASHLLPEMQKYSSAASSAFTPPFAKWPILLLTLNNNNLLLSSSAVQKQCISRSSNVSVLTVMPRHVSTERLALVTHSFVTSFTATCARSRSLAMGFPTTPCAMRTCWHKTGYYPTEDLALCLRIWFLLLYSEDNLQVYITKRVCYTGYWHIIHTKWLYKEL